MIYRCLAGFLFLLTLTACGGGGASAPIEESSISVSTSIVSANQPLTRRFTVSVSSDLADAVLRWNFGDGTVSTSTGSESILHAFTEAGLYNITISRDDVQDTSFQVIVGDNILLDLSGEVIPLNNTVIDGDINDPNAPYIENNSLDQAQLVPPVSVISGFVSDVATGLSGDRFAQATDVEDFYLVDLEAGQSVFLEIAGWSSVSSANNDFDLSLYTANDQQEIASSVGVNKTELLTIPSSGSYIIRVYSYSGTGNYTLRLINQNQPASLSFSQHISTQQDFALGQAIVQMRAGQQLRSELNLGNISLLQSNADMGLLKLDIPQTRSAGDSSDYADKLATLMAIKVLSLQSNFTVSPNFYYQPQALSADPLVARQWHYPQIKLEEAWDFQQGLNLAPVTVAVIDTGIYQNHPDLRNQLSADGYDFISDPENAGDGDGFDANPEDPGDRSNPDGGSSWHGTHVAGTIAAQTNNNIGGAGVAPGASIMNLRALGLYGGSTWDISQAMLYAAGLSNASNRLPNRNADIINMSLGGEGYDASFASVTQRVINAGVIIIAAAGNSSTTRLSYPAAFDDVVGVSALDARNELTSYSNYGTYVDIAAPGGNSSQDLNGDGYGDGIYSTYVDESGSALQASYSYLNGTSMAAPHVAGVAALMKQVSPELTPSQFNMLLADGDLTTDLGASGRDSSFGYGLIDAEKALRVVAGESETEQTQLDLDVSQLYLSSQQVSAEFTLSKRGSDPLSVQSIVEDSPWLTVSPLLLDADNFGRYHVSVDRNGLSDGTYNADVTITGSDNQDIYLSVTMVVSNIQAVDSGVIYVSLFNAETSAFIAQRQVMMRDGVFSYSFDDLAPGLYRVTAGSDHNNDQNRCDEGELCGAYPVLAEQQEIILIDSNRQYDLSLEPMITEDLTGQVSSRQLVE